jgi:uroporphyrinogen decarboxylase
MRPDIEQLIKTLKRGKADHLPIAELGIHNTIKEKFLGRPIHTLKDDVDFWYQAGYDYIKLQPDANFNSAAIGLDGDHSIDEDSRKWATTGKGVITTINDFEQYKFPKASDFDYSKFEQVKSLLPEGMGVVGQYGDILTLTWEMMGFEEFSVALFTNPELIQILMDKIGNLVLKMFETMAQSDVVDVLWYSDDISYTNGLLISPVHLKYYFFPWLKKIGDLAKENNKPLIYHTDGILYDVFENIMDCGVDAIHPIEPAAMKIAEVKAKVGDKLSLIGNIDMDMLSRGTPEAVRLQVIKNIEQVGYNGGYCVGSGNSVPEYVKFENYLAMITTAKEIG